MTAGRGDVAVLSFLGATGTVTGSRFLLETGGGRWLVDCGMYQGLKHLRQRNWQPPPVEPSSVDGVILTHAHLDHSGMLPALVRDGFKGPIVATTQTAELAAVVMADSGHLQEEDARFANERGYSKHTPALPLYTEEDAVAAAQRFRPVAFRAPLDLGGVTVTLFPAGHILGSSSVLVETTGATRRRVFFSGDVGRGGHPILRPPRPRRPPTSWWSSRPTATAATRRRPTPASASPT